MKNKYFKYVTVFTFLFAGLQFFAAHSVSAQRRDHLTEMEVELVRDAQEIDSRMDIFVKAIDRRFLVLNNDTSQAKQIEKDLDKWGELPTGTRAQILRDIEKILDESISKIDDVATRDMKSDLFPVAVNVLANGAVRFLPELKSQLDKTTVETEKGSILNSIEFCEQIISASAKVPKLNDKQMKRMKKDGRKIPQ
jgi:hypothetical protein